MKSNLSLIIQREYFERVKRKSFIISTILMPLLMLAMMVVPTVIAIMAKPDVKVVAVIDDTNVIAPMLQSDGTVTFKPVKDDLNTLKERAGDDDSDYEAILVINADAISQPAGNISLYTQGSPSMVTESYITTQLTNAIRDKRIRAYNIDNLSQILEEVEPDVVLSTYRIDKEDETETSSGLSYGISMFVMLILYMFILLYGQMVMTSIIEEKNNRVLELVVSSVKPTDLMSGKILGIGMVAVTQILIWVVLLMACTMWLMPPLLKAASVSEPGLAAGMGQLADPAFMGRLLLMLVLFLIGGYLFYSSIFAALGSAVDNIQDASQLTVIPTVPIIIALMISLTVATDPNSTIAMWCSFIPFTSPMVMMARIPFGIPVWQEVVSLVILYLSFWGMMWVCGKIYRVGIFMYGKKPNIKDLAKWVRYK